MSVRVIIGSSTEKTLKNLSTFLVENGFNVVAETTDGYELLRKVHSIYPDLVIIDYKLKGINGHEVSETLINDKICPIIALINTLEVQYFINLNQEPSFVTIEKPCNKQILINTINLLSITKLEKQLTQLTKENEVKTFVDEAKALLIQHMNLTEEEAHRRIQKQSMDKGLSKIVVAKGIISMYK